MRVQVEEVSSNIVCADSTFLDPLSVQWSSNKLSTTFELNRYHPNCHFTMTYTSSYQITEERHQRKMKLCLEQINYTSQEDKPISVLLDPYPGDKVYLSWSQGTDGASNVWTSEEILLNDADITESDPDDIFFNCPEDFKFQTLKLWILFSPRPLTMLEDMEKLFLDQNNCDVHFYFDNGKKIGAHIIILKLRSPVFAAMFEHEMEEKATGRVHIQDIDPDIFNQLLYFMYCGWISAPLTCEMAKALYVAADKYEVGGLRNECISCLLSNVRVDNVLALIIFAHLHSIEALKTDAIQMVKENARLIVQQEHWANLIEQHHDLSVEVTRRMFSW